MYNHILIGFDDSEDSMKALERAAQLYAMNSDCKITVAHVIQHINIATNRHLLSFTLIPILLVVKNPSH